MHDYNSMRANSLSRADPAFLCNLFAVFACGSLVTADPRVHREGGYSAQDSPAAKTGSYNFGLSATSKAQGITRPGHRFYAQCNILLLHCVSEPSINQAVLYGLLA